MKRISVKIILAISILSTALSSQASEFKNWILAYHHDANGAAISGSFEALVAAIQNGADVRVGFGNVNGKPTSFREDGVLIYNTAPSIDEVILSSKIPAINTDGTGKLTLVPSRYGYELLSTHGTRIVNSYVLSTGALDGPRISQIFEMFWYVSK